MMLLFLFILITASGAVGAYYHAISPLFGIGLSLLGLGLLLLLGIPSLIAFLRPGRLGIANYLKVLFCLIAGGALGTVFFQEKESPFTDIVSNGTQAPPFLRTLYSAHLEGAPERLLTKYIIDRSYSSDEWDAQKRKYPSLIGVKIAAPPEQAFLFTQETIKKHFPDWKIVQEDKEKHQMEIEVETLPFRWITDIAIAIHDDLSQASIIDYRARTRLPFSDMGLTGKKLIRLQKVFTAMVPGFLASNPPVSTPVPAAIPQEITPVTPIPVPVPVTPEKQ